MRVPRIEHTCGVRNYFFEVCDIQTDWQRAYPVNLEGACEGARGPCAATVAQHQLHVHCSCVVQRHLRVRHHHKPRIGHLQSSATRSKNSLRTLFSVLKYLGFWKKCDQSGPPPTLSSEEDVIQGNPSHSGTNISTAQHPPAMVGPTNGRRRRST